MVFKRKYKIPLKSRRFVLVLQNKYTIMKLQLILIFLITSLQKTFAQVSVENFFRTESKFYVVVAVLAIVMAGLLLYVIYLDKKIQKIEKQITENQETTQESTHKL